MASRPSPLTYLYLFDHALDQEIGIAFIVSAVPREHFRSVLYEARKQSGDSRYEELILFAPAALHENEIWICKKEVEMDV